MSTIDISLNLRSPTPVLQTGGNVNEIVGEYFKHFIASDFKYFSTRI